MNKILWKPISFFSINLLIISLCSAALAGVIGNPIPTIKPNGFQMGIEGDMVKRDVKIEDEEETEEVKSNRYMLKGTFGITDKINIYAKLGMADGKIDLPNEMDLDDDSFAVDDFKGDLEFCYGAGLKALIYNQDNLKLGFSFQLHNFKTEDNIFEGVEAIYVEDLDEWLYLNKIRLEIDWWEYDLAFGSSYDIQGNFTVYGGIMYSKLDGEMTVKIEASDFYGYTFSGSDKVDAEEDDSFGVFLGGTFNINPQFSVGLEGRFIHETSFALTAGYAF